MPEQDDWNVDVTEEPEEEEQDVLSYNLYYPADLTLKGYLEKNNNKQLVIPSFQRSYVWDQVKASKLIESFLLGLPVPGVFLYKERDTNKLQVIDGQQRIFSAVRYFKNDFDDKSFRLKNVHPKWNGKKYEDLDEADRFELDDAVLRATVVQQLGPHDDSSVFHIFERLNTGGINLNPMEIRSAYRRVRQFSLLEDLKVWKIGANSLDSQNRTKDFAIWSWYCGWSHYRTRGNRTRSR